MSSMLNDLRQFRLQKAKMSSNDNTPKAATVRKRIQLMDDGSESDDAEETVNNQTKKIKSELTVEDKEKRFLCATKITQEYCSMDVQDSLVRCNWNVTDSIHYLKKHYPKKPTVTTALDKPHKNAATEKIRGSSSNSSSSSYNRNHKSTDSNNLKTNMNRKYRESEQNKKPGIDKELTKFLKTEENVYDDSESDDDNYYQKVSTTNTKKSVLQFLNNAELLELLTVRSLSEKKAQAIIEMRPFKEWKDLNERLDSIKGLNCDILGNIETLLEKRRNVAKLMDQCNEIVKNLETSIATGAGVTEQPSNLEDGLKLADYQLIGLNWLVVMQKQKVNAILADEMGLGKTIQVIAFFAYMKEKQLSKAPHLIVVPPSTLDNWEQEISKWCPSLIVEKYYGNQDARRVMRYHFGKHGFKDFDILLTTYNMVIASPEERKMFRVCKMHYVVFDEAHMLKNMTTIRYQQLITINAESRILLTGTPLQNNLLELMSLLCFLMPSMFNRNTEDLKFLFGKKPLGKAQDNIDIGSFDKSQVENAKRIVKPFLLRRMKQDVLQHLPPKTEYIRKITMTNKQKQYYKEIYDYYSTKSSDSNAEVISCSILMDMRKLANHPLLMRHHFNDDDVRQIAGRLAKCSTYKQDNSEYVFEDIAWKSDFQIYQLCQKYELDDITIPRNLILDSGKFMEFDKLLPELKAGGHRVLIFSQFVMMLDVIEKYMDIRKHRYLRLDGMTVVSERQELIDDFNNDPGIFCFLISTKAGGLGINLTAADTCIIHDIDFNPYNDKQAEDRIHRMGQKKPVSIYRFISDGTIEEAMHIIGMDKLNLEKKISGGDNDKVEHKCMVRLLSMVLNLDENRAAVILDQSPIKGGTSVIGNKPIDGLEDF